MNEDLENNVVEKQMSHIGDSIRSVEYRMSENGDKKDGAHQRKVRMKDTRIEVVKKKTKISYMLKLEERMKKIQKMKDDAEKIDEELRDWFYNEIFMAEMRLDMDVKRVAAMIVVDEDGEVFASE